MPWEGGGSYTMGTYGSALQWQANTATLVLSSGLCGLKAYHLCVDNIPMNYPIKALTLAC